MNNALNNIKIPILGLLGEKNKPDEKKIYENDDKNNLLNLQIIYALKSISGQYASKNNESIKSPICDYFCNYNLNNFNISNNINNNNNEKRNKTTRFNNYYNKFSIGFNSKNYKNCK